MSSVPAARRLARMSARRVPDPGTEGCRPADGDMYDWRNKRPWSPYCGGPRRPRPQTIPAAEAEAECTVHGKVPRLHDCEDGRVVALPGEAS